MVKLYVVSQRESLAKSELIAYCRQYLAGYKVPKAVEFCAELPKSTVGKVLRKVLRNGATAQ